MPFHNTDRGITGGFSDIYFVPSGKSLVRILPSWKDNGPYWKRFKEHFLKLGDRQTSVVCPTQASQACPICEFGAELQESGDPEKIERSEDLVPSNRYYFNALILDTPPAFERAPSPDEVKILKGGYTIQNPIVKMDQDAAGKWQDVTDPAHGVNLTIEKEGAGRYKTRYTVTPDERCDIFEYLDKKKGIVITEDELASRIKDLDEATVPLSYGELKNLLDESSVQRIGKFVLPTSPVTEPTEDEGAGDDIPFNPSISDDNLDVPEPPSLD